MAAPKLSRIIALKVAVANIGEFAIVRNLTRGGQLTAKIDKTNREVILNPAPNLQWQDGDLIQAEVTGRIEGVSQKKIQAGGTNMTIEGTVDTTTPGVSL